MIGISKRVPEMVTNEQLCSQLQIIQIQMIIIAQLQCYVGVTEKKVSSFKPIKLTHSHLQYNM